MKGDETMGKKHTKDRDPEPQEFQLLAIEMDGFEEEEAEYLDVTLPDGSGLRIYVEDRSTLRLETHSPVRKVLVKNRTYQGISVTHRIDPVPRGTVPE